MDVSLQSTGVHKGTCAAHDIDMYIYIHIQYIHMYLHGTNYATNSLTAEYVDSINITKPCKMV
jgi:hypothetical protein